MRPRLLLVLSCRVFQAGKVDRREFLRTSTLLGLSATAAYGLAGCDEKKEEQASSESTTAATTTTQTATAPAENVVVRHGHHLLLCAAV